MYASQVVSVLFAATEILAYILVCIAYCVLPFGSEILSSKSGEGSWRCSAIIFNPSSALSVKCDISLIWAGYHWRSCKRHSVQRSSSILEIWLVQWFRSPLYLSRGLRYLFWVTEVCPWHLVRQWLLVPQGMHLRRSSSCYAPGY